jgi:hypothetical protein
MDSVCYLGQCGGRLEYLCCSCVSHMATEREPGAWGLSLGNTGTQGPGPPGWGWIQA